MGEKVEAFIENLRILGYQGKIEPSQVEFWFHSTNPAVKGFLSWVATGLTKGNSLLTGLDARERKFLSDRPPLLHGKELLEELKANGLIQLDGRVHNILDIDISQDILLERKKKDLKPSRDREKIALKRKLESMRRRKKYLVETKQRLEQSLKDSEKQKEAEGKTMETVKQKLAGTNQLMNRSIADTDHVIRQILKSCNSKEDYIWQLIVNGHFGGERDVRHVVNLLKTKLPVDLIRNRHTAKWSKNMKPSDEEEEKKYYADICERISRVSRSLTLSKIRKASLNAQLDYISKVQKDPGGPGVSSNLQYCTDELLIDHKENEKELEEIAKSKPIFIRLEEMNGRTEDHKKLLHLLASAQETLKAQRARTLLVLHILQRESDDVNGIEKTLGCLNQVLDPSKLLPRKQNGDMTADSSKVKLDREVPKKNVKAEDFDKKYDAVNCAIESKVDLPSSVKERLSCIDIEINQMLTESYRYTNLLDMVRSELWGLEEASKTVEAEAVKVIRKYSQLENSLRTNEEIQNKRERFFREILQHKRQT